MSPSPLPDAHSLGLRPSDPTRLHYCHCSGSCAAWSDHPLGNPLHALFYDNHRVQEVVRLQPRYKRGYLYKSFHHGMPSPTKLLQDSQPQRQGHFLVAVGEHACELGPQCYLSWEEATAGNREGSYARGRCSRHRGAMGACLTANREGHPFAPLFDWSPEQPKPEWSRMYRWLTQPQLREFSAEPRELGNATTPPTSPAPLFHDESDAGTPPPPPDLPHSSTVTQLNIMGASEPVPQPLPESVPATPAKRRRMSTTDALPSQGELDLDDDLDRDLQRKFAALKAEIHLAQLAGNEARARQVKDEQWVARAVAEVGRCAEERDPSAGRRTLENLFRKYAQEVNEREERDAALAPRGPELGPLEMAMEEEEEAKVAIAIAADVDGRT